MLSHPILRRRRAIGESKEDLGGTRTRDPGNYARGRILVRARHCAIEPAGYMTRL